MIARVGAASVLSTTAAVAGLVFGGPTFVADAAARVTCAYASAPAHVLTVTVTAADDFLEVSRHRDEILVNESFERPKQCIGSRPTVLNTDTINVIVRGDLTSADLHLSGGPFAPGATPEPGGASEIEIRVTAPDGIITVSGTSRADEYHWGPGGGQAGLNLNPRTANDQDVDVTLIGRYSFLVMNGGRGNDTIIPAPGWAGPAEGIYSEGGRGNDLLSAPTNVGGILNGGHGKDRLIGGASADQLDGGAGGDDLDGGGGHDHLNGGRGRDLILGGLGRDVITSRDRNRDRVRCGPGRDRVGADRRDRLRGCERVRRR